MVRLVPMSTDRLGSWFSTMWSGYYHDLVGAGNTPGAARLNIERNKSALLVDGVPNSDQFVFDVLDGDVVVGALWLARRDGDGTPQEWFVYNIVIDEEFRGQGFGRATMQAALDYVKAQGGRKLGLNVFGPNVVARHLYESMGFQTVSLQMQKEIS